MDFGLRGFSDSIYIYIYIYIYIVYTFGAGVATILVLGPFRECITWTLWGMHAAHPCREIPSDSSQHHSLISLHVDLAL